MDVAKVEINSPKLFWISGVQFAQPGNYYKIKNFINFIRQNNIDTIVNLSDYPTSQKLLKIYNQAGVGKVLTYPLDDRFFHKHEYQQLKNVLEALYQKLGNRILVNCTAGVNRSATLIVYSILRDSYLGPDEIIEKLRESNKKWRLAPALTNPTFVDFLQNVRNI